MKFFGKTLNHAVQEVLLSHPIVGPLDEFQHFRQNNSFVDFHVDSFKRANSHQIFPDEHFQVISLSLPLLFVSSSSNTHPKVCWFFQVNVNSLDSFLHTPCFSLILTSSIRKTIFAHLQEIVSQEKSSQRILYGFHHWNYIVENLVWTLLMTLNVNTACSDQ